MLSPEEEPKKRRNRRREGAGKSENSWKKHSLIWKAMVGQVSAFRRKKDGRIFLPDFNAGEGIGVEHLQLDMFDTNRSRATPETLVHLAEKFGNADVILCEKDRERRLSLQQQFPDVQIIGDHAGVLDHIRNDHVWACPVSDPCGPSAHGIQYMRAIAQRMSSDFIVVFNEGWIKGWIEGSTDEKLAVHRERYLPMLEPNWWLEKLERRHMARTPLIKQSNQFNFRLLVISNYLSDAVKRQPFEVVR